MILFYPKVSKISIKRYRIADSTPDTVLIHLEIMLATFGLLHIDDLQRVPLNDDLRLQRVAFFSPNNTLFDLFSGGLWDFQ
ncbi:hypothetical protein FACS1894110_20170 [Spirochaetia bacterium]|nr:hypothetical protein FACS1894110_20170 [Spirochaetia bacterium]